MNRGEENQSTSLYSAQPLHELKATPFPIICSCVFSTHRVKAPAVQQPISQETTYYGQNTLFSPYYFLAAATNISHDINKKPNKTTCITTIQNQFQMREKKNGEERKKIVFYVQLDLIIHLFSSPPVSSIII